MTKITATGTSTRHYAAERATISIGISVTNDDRHAAIGEATDMHNEALRLGRLLEEERRATFVKGLAQSTYAHDRDNFGQMIPTFTTRSTVLVKLSDLGYVSEFIALLQKQGYGVRVSWSLTKDNTEEYTRVVRRRAVEKARDVADDYAIALGTQVDKVVSISDATSTDRGLVGARAKSAASDPTAEVTIPEIAVSASIVGVYKTAKNSGLDY